MKTRANTRPYPIPRAEAGGTLHAAARVLRQFAGCGVLAAALLAGCNKHDQDLLPDGKQPVSFTAEMEEQSAVSAAQSATRATADNTWTGTEQVTVSMEGEVKEYTVATNGTLTVAQGGTTFYWTNTTMKAEAWYSVPYSDSKPASFSVQAGQNDAAEYQQSDMLYASQDITFNKSTPVPLTFKHLPVKVVVNLKAGNGVTTDEVQNATVSIVGQNLTSGAINAADWSVEQRTTGSEVITPNPATVTDGYLKTVQALVVPQKSTTSVRFIRVAVGGQEFFYSATTDFAAGKQYTYNITVLKNGLSVTASEAQPWDGSTIDVTSATNYIATDLKIGDYYYSDGEWSDGGLRKTYADRTFVKEDIDPVLTDASGKTRTVLGIVFKVGKDADGSWKDDGSYKLKGSTTEMSTIHGYVLALKDGNSGKTCTWGSHGTIVGTDQTQETLFCGYSNMQMIKNYLSNNSGKTLQNDFPAAYHASEGYETIEGGKYSSPSNSSGWFLPSAGQCRYWYQNKDLLKESMDKAGGDGWYDYYWSSSEYKYGATYDAWYVRFGDGYVSTNLKDSTYRVRCALAF